MSIKESVSQTNNPRIDFIKAVLPFNKYESDNPTPVIVSNQLFCNNQKHKRNQEALELYLQANPLDHFQY